MDYSIKNPHLQLLSTLAAIAGHHQKRYCYPKQATIIARHAATTGREYSPATLNRHLRSLEAQGWISRTRRHRRNSAGQLELHSTLYSFTARAANYLARLLSKLQPWAGFFSHRFAREAVQNLCGNALLRSLSSERISTDKAENKAAGAQVRPPAS